MRCGSLKSPNVCRDQCRTLPKPCKGLAECAVAFVRRSVKPVVGRHLPRRLPYGLHGVELRRVRWEAEERDIVRVLVQPPFPFVVQVVTGAVVDDQEDLPPRVFGDESLEEAKERLSIEDVGELVAKSSVLQPYCSEEVSGLSLTIGVDARLASDARPSSMKRSVEPEAGFVPEEDNTSTCGGFFLIAGNFSFNQMACFSASARANRFRGRCTENPSRCSRRGM